MVKLTKSAIEKLQAPQSGQVFLWDSELRGFGVRITPGGTKSFILQYRNGEARTRRMQIGRFGVLTVDQARTEAKAKLGAVATGADPASDKQTRRDAPTVAQICDWYLDEAESGRLLGRRNRPIKASTLYMDRSRIDRHIKPLIGTRQVRALNSIDIARLQTDIASGKTSRSRRSGRGRVSQGGAGAAARTISTIHSIFAHAKRMGLINENPASGVRRLAGSQRERRLSAAEISRFGQAMRELAERDESPRGLALVRLLSLTGFRLNEAQALQRHWFDSQKSECLFPDTKSDAQRRAIGRLASELISAQPEKAGSPYVFPADLSDSHYKQGPDVILRICRQAKIEGVTAHTLRHTFGSVAGDLGFSELTIAAMLGHGKRGVTQGYVHIDEGLRLAIERTSNKIAELLDGGSTTIVS
jgi:integrase